MGRMNSEIDRISGISCAREGDTDMISFEGDLDEALLDKLGQTISTLRQQGSRRILIRGKNIRRIRSQDIEKLALPIRIFRGTGGIIALAEFGKEAIRQLRAASWFRYLNVFQSFEEAMIFFNLSIDSDDKEDI